MGYPKYIGVPKHIVLREKPGHRKSLCTLKTNLKHRNKILLINDTSYKFVRTVSVCQFSKNGTIIIDVLKISYRIVITFYSTDFTRFRFVQIFALGFRRYFGIPKKY